MGSTEVKSGPTYVKHAISHALELWDFLEGGVDYNLFINVALNRGRR